MPRKISRKGLIKKLDELAGEYVKRRDKHICQHCGKYVEGTNEHVSHVIPRSAGHKLRWDYKNLKILCFRCHINWWHKNPIESGEWFKEKFPERHKYLQKNRGIKRFTMTELKELREKIESDLE